MSPKFNNAIIYRKFQTFGPIEDGQTVTFEQRRYELPEPGDGDTIIQTLYYALDVFLVTSRYLILEIPNSQPRPSLKGPKISCVD